MFNVIQQMSFRRDGQGQCIDYVQFGQPERTLFFDKSSFKYHFSPQWGPKMCGNVNGFQVDVSDDELNNNNNNDDTQVENAFIDMGGLIEVQLHLGNKSVNVNEELSFEIVFTAFQECNYDNGLWKSCGSRKCIYKEFFQDGKLNCPYKSCKDESSCHPAVTPSGNDDHFNMTFKTQIMVDAVYSCLLMLLVIVLACIAFLWVFRNCDTALCCLGFSNGRPHSSEMQRVPNLETVAFMPSAPPDLVKTQKSKGSQSQRKKGRRARVALALNYF